MLETVKFIKEHENWRELLKQAPYCLTINEDNNYVIFKYSQIDSDFNEQICRECRGLVVDLHTYEPIALSFFKFFNYGEPFADKIYWKQCRVQEKIDGSKMLVWYNRYEGKWQISTSSQLDAYKANVSDFGITFGQLFDKALQTLNITNEQFYELLDRNFCYTFELVSPESRVVIPYKKTKIFFIGVRYVPDFEEYNPDSFTSLCSVIPRPKEYPLPNLKSCLAAVEHMEYDEEGFVVVDNHWKRVKIKSPAYVLAHYLRNNGVNSKARILEIIEKNEQEEFLTYFPEYKDYFEEVEKTYNDYKDKLYKAIIDIKFKMEANESVFHTWSQKDFASYINIEYNDISSFLFQFMKEDLIKMFIDVQWNRLTRESKMKRLGLKYQKENSNE